MDHLDPGLAMGHRARSAVAACAGVDVRARTHRAGAAVATGPVGAAQAGVGEAGEGTEDDQVEGQEQRDRRSARAGGGRRRAAAARPAPRPAAAAPASAPTQQDRGQRRQVVGSGAFIGPAGPSRPTRRSRRSRSRLSAPDRGRAGPASSSGPRVDDVQVVLQCAGPRQARASEPALRAGTRSTVRGRDRRRLPAASRRAARRRRRSSQTLSTPVRVAAERLRAAGAGSTGGVRKSASQAPPAHDDQQPLALQRGRQRSPRPPGRPAADRRAWAGRHDQLAVVGAPLRPDRRNRPGTTPPPAPRRPAAPAASAGAPGAVRAGGIARLRATASAWTARASGRDAFSRARRAGTDELEPDIRDLP